MSNDHNRDWALRLAEAGIAVFPCGPDKKPLIKWREFSSSDLETVAQWWREHPGALPAIDLAKSDLFALDGDRHGGPDGRKALRELLQQQPNFDWRTARSALTPGDGAHVYFSQNGHEFGNGRGRLPDGVDVRGYGGYTICPYAVLPDGRRYRTVPGTADLISAFKAGTIPNIPQGIVDLIQSKDPHTNGRDHFGGDAGAREKAFAAAALKGCMNELAGTNAGSRNEKLNAVAYRLGRMIARNWIDRAAVESALLGAMHCNGGVADDGVKAAKDTLNSGIEAGLREPHPDLNERERVPSATAGQGGAKTAASQNDDVRLEDFVAYMPMHAYIFKPTREMWPAASVNSRIPPAGAEKASSWLDKNAPVEQMTWAPGEPMLITGRLVAEGGWIERTGVTCFNLYRPPTITPGNAVEAGPWLDHVHKIYPEDANHIIAWLAQRVQRPAEKVNHALVLGGLQGIGKDTMLEPAKRAVGPWNVHEVSPQHMLGRFNGFLRSVILRVNEARDLGDVNRFGFYDHLKAYTAVPPDVLRVDEKNLREYSVLNCCGVILTSNHKSDGIYLPADDRRHYVAWSDLSKDSFRDTYWTNLWGWYNGGGDRHVAAYLAEHDISGFDPKAPPPKTAAFWAIVDASRAPEDAELADILDHLGNPDATTLIRVQNMATGDFQTWIMDRKNRRQVPYRFEQCGYVPVRNDAAVSGLWVINNTRQVVYAKAELSLRDRIAAARRLTSGGK